MTIIDHEQAKRKILIELNHNLLLDIHNRLLSETRLIMH